jgi:hypothetical protein
MNCLPCTRRTGGDDINSEENLGQRCSNFGRIEGVRRGD